ncbi:hypothetical protein Tco_1093173 [Tanacetum coccineum]|uniref:Uncharacterized protein n=1 Tax=Tanacetum coccineum TaxID=301880 RepID=A0ABQ5IC05_9ASTR
MEEEENEENNGSIDKSIMDPGKPDEEEPPKGIDIKNEVKRKTDDESTKSARENVMKNEEDEPARGTDSANCNTPKNTTTQRNTTWGATS